MHKEYRVVATLDTLHGYDYSHYHYEKAACHFGGTAHKFVTTDYDKAVVYLERAKTECPKYDKESEILIHDDPTNHIQYCHSNIRIQSRTVSDWEDE